MIFHSKFLSCLVCITGLFLLIQSVCFAANDTTTLQNEITAVSDGGTVFVTDNIRFDPPPTSITLDASKSYTISGMGGQMTLWGNRVNPLFDSITTGIGKTVTFRNLDFADGKGVDGGVFSSTNPADHLTLNFDGNTNIHNNYADHGGAIFGGTQNFYGYGILRFTDNRAIAGNGGAINGGTQTIS